VSESSILKFPALNLGALAEKFHEKDIKWRVKDSGISKKNGKPWAQVLAYVDARAIMDRLDKVVGPDNWRTQFHHLEGGVMCDLSIKINGEWITKQDGSPDTKVEAFKGGISKALVRAAVHWGIGRYLYDLETNFADFVDDRSSETYSSKIDNEYYNWLPPALPAWALPEGHEPQNKQRQHQAGQPAGKINVPPKKEENKNEGLGAYVVTLGSNKDKRLDQLSRDEINAMIKGVGEIIKKKKAPSGMNLADLQELYKNATAFVGGAV
jgi:hypothetical protein